MPELTGPQLVPGQTTLPAALQGQVGITAYDLTEPFENCAGSKTRLTTREVRELRRDPTVKLGRIILSAPAIQAGWSVESDDETDKTLIEIHQELAKRFVPLHAHIMGSALLGCIDYGFQAFEKVWEVEPETGLFTLKKLKKLLPENVTIMVDEHGAFVGLKVNPNEVFLTPAECLLVYQNVEGTNWYGESDMTAVYPPWKAYRTVEKASDRYDSKIAGAHWVVYYPPGRTDYNGVVSEDNEVIARDILSKIESSGRLIIPRKVSDIVQSLNDVRDDTKSLWEIQILEASGAANSTMLERMQYIDKLKIRAFGVPERAALEGQHGTLAESESHNDYALHNINTRCEQITQEINWHLINQFIDFNWGPEYRNKVRLAANPVSDANIKFVRDMYSKLLDNEATASVMLPLVDTRGLAERVDMPLLGDGTSLVKLPMPLPTPKPEPEPEQTGGVPD